MQVNVAHVSVILNTLLDVAITPLHNAGTNAINVEEVRRAFGASVCKSPDLSLN